MWTDITAFFAENNYLLTAITDVLMAAIWFSYFTLFYVIYRKSQRTHVFISNIASPVGNICSVGNLSESAVYLDDVIIQVRGEKEKVDKQILLRDALANRRYRRGGKSSQAEEIGAERSLAKAESLTLGTYKDMVESIHGRRQSTKENKLHGKWIVTVRVVFLVASERTAVGACRSFVVDIDKRGKTLVEPREAVTQQYTSRRQRQQVLRWVAGVKKYAHLPKRG